MPINPQVLEILRINPENQTACNRQGLQSSLRSPSQRIHGTPRSPSSPVSGARTLDRFGTELTRSTRSASPRSPGSPRKTRSPRKYGSSRSPPAPLSPQSPRPAIEVDSLGRLTIEDAKRWPWSPERSSHALTIIPDTEPPQQTESINSFGKMMKTSTFSPKSMDSDVENMEGNKQGEDKELNIEVVRGTKEEKKAKKVKKTSASIEEKKRPMFLKKLYLSLTGKHADDGYDTNSTENIEVNADGTVLVRDKLKRSIWCNICSSTRKNRTIPALIVLVVIAIVLIITLGLGGQNNKKSSSNSEQPLPTSNNNTNTKTNTNSDASGSKETDDDDSITFGAFAPPDGGWKSVSYKLSVKDEAGNGCSLVKLDTLLATCPFAMKPPSYELDKPCQMVSSNEMDCRNLLEQNIESLEFTCYGKDEKDLSIKVEANPGLFCNSVLDSSTTSFDGGVSQTKTHGGTASIRLSVISVGECGNVQVAGSDVNETGCQTVESCSSTTFGQESCSGSDSCTAVLEDSLQASANMSSSTCVDVLPVLSIGDECNHGIYCSTGYCVNGICSEDGVQDLGPCEEDFECGNSVCAYQVGRSGDDSKICCPRGQFTDKWTTYSGDPYCVNMPDGTFCLDDSLCLSGSCGVWYEGQNDSEMVCCPKGKSFGVCSGNFEKQEFSCGNSLGNSSCGGPCTGGLCYEEPVEDGTVCQRASDCESGACGYASMSSNNTESTICCSSGEVEKHFIEDGGYYGWFCKDT